MNLFKSRVTAPTLEAADAARAARDWAKARDGYARFVEAFPQRYDIWVQLGHSKKELGDISGAEAAYRQSIALNSEVADSYLQLGHALKLLGRIDDAIEAYARAVELDPKLGSARRELRALGFESQQTSNDAARMLIDLSDVFFYLRHHSTVSGIQRVQLGLAEALIQTANRDVDVTFLTELGDHSGYAEVEPGLITHLIRVLSKPKVELEELQKIAEQAASDGLPYNPVKGDLLLILGAFWVLPNVIEQIIVLKSKGVRIGVMIHDIIPITHPEFCEKALTDTFNLYIRSVVKIVDQIISISEHTQSEVRQLLEREKIRPPEMYVLRNAHTSWDFKRKGIAAQPSSEVAGVLQTKYVLYVSTIEIRKNHTLLFRIWKRLLREMGSATPRLVFVGRPGWRVRDLMDQIVGTDYLDGYITILHDIPDTDLEQLYRNAMFTAFTSFEEGWGLPVGESLIFGRPCVASNASSIPEVGGEFVDYVNPLDVNEAYPVFARMIQDEQYRADRCRAIATEFKPRTWNDVARDLLAQSGKLVGAPFGEGEGTDSKLLAPTLEPGKIHFVGHKEDRSYYINSGLGPVVHFLFDSHWYPLESFGRWLAGGNGSLRFSVPPESRGPIQITIVLSTVPWIGALPIQVFVGDKALKPFTLAAGAQSTLLFEADASSGVVTIKFFAKGTINQGTDVRKDLCLGIVSLAYAGRQDLAARLSLIEETLAQRPDVIKLARQNGAI